MFSAVLITAFYFYPAYAAQATAIITSIPMYVANFIASVNQHLAVIGLTAGALLVPVGYAVNSLWKRAKENTETKAKEQVTEAQNLLLVEKQKAAELALQSQAKDNIIAEYEKASANTSSLLSQVKALETENFRVATERNQLAQQLKEWQLKYIPEQKVK